MKHTYKFFWFAICLCEYTFAVDSDVDSWTPRFTATTAESVIKTTPFLTSNATAYVSATKIDLAGYYANGEILSGYDLHLFFDGTYFLAYWADISPMRIHESGRWEIHKDAIFLSMEKSYDSELAMNPWRQDRKYFILKKGGDIYLMGNHFWYSLFKDDCLYEKTFDWCSFKRRIRYDGSNNSETKEKLIQESWKPWLTEEEKKTFNHSLERIKR